MDLFKTRSIVEQVFENPVKGPVFFKFGGPVPRPEIFKQPRCEYGRSRECLLKSK
jgi:hypothetical protein